jgi:hypothetical protein
MWYLGKDRASRHPAAAAGGFRAPKAAANIQLKGVLQTPLRDHFRPPLDRQSAWEDLHGQWPAMIVQQLPIEL